MAVKSNPKQLANSNSTGGTTFTLSVACPVEGMDLKRETNEATIVITVSAISGTTPTLGFDVDEFVNGTWVHVGTTGSVSTASSMVIDSSGGAQSSGGTTFTATSALRLLGKGTDTRVRVGVAGTIGTVNYTIDYIGYFG